MKGLRHQAIRDLVTRRRVRTQQELAAALRERGFRATQATISRDVSELGLHKVPRDGVLAYALPARGQEPEATAEERLRGLVRDLPFQVHEAGLLLVLRTLPGSAHALANALDRTPWTEVVGTIAGDDTVFVACRDRASRRAVQERLKRIVAGG
ncbi:MAG: arginine repressor [Candidatus Limnocylindrales bacterium]